LVLAAAAAAAVADDAVAFSGRDIAADRFTGKSATRASGANIAFQA